MTLTHPAWAGGGLPLAGGAIIGWLLLTLLMGGTVLGGPGVFAVMCLACGFIVWNGGATGLTVLLVLLVGQNLALSLASPGLSEDTGLFNLLQASNFVVLGLVSSLAALKMWRHENELDGRERQLLWWVFAAGAVLGAYALLGMALGLPFKNIAIYLRTFASGLMLLVLGLHYGRTLGRETLLQSLAVVTALAAAYGWIELFYTEQLYEFINYHEYLDLKYAGRQSFDGIQHIIAEFTRSFMNFPLFADLGLASFRLGGPNLHPISYGYILALGTLVAVMRGRWWWLPLYLLPLAEVGAKGPLILTVACLGLAMLARLWPRLAAAATAGALGAYVSVGVWYGLRTADYHVIGFMGGVRGFLNNPLGHGLGAGGNFGAASDSGFDWATTQAFGADYGLESSIGVLLYQLGLATAVLLAVYGLLARALWPHAGRAAAYLPALMVLVVVTNGVFQEEAFSPYALGMIALLAGGMVHAAREREKDADGHAAG